MGQDILFEVPRWLSSDSLLRWQNIQGNFSRPSLFSVRCFSSFWPEQNCSGNHMLSCSVMAIFLSYHCVLHYIYNIYNIYNIYPFFPSSSSDFYWPWISIWSVRLNFEPWSISLQFITLPSSSMVVWIWRHMACIISHGPLVLQSVLHLFVMFIWCLPLMIFLSQGGNDHEIYESDRTIGHTGTLPFFMCLITLFSFTASFRIKSESWEGALKWQSNIKILS